MREVLQAKANVVVVIAAAVAVAVVVVVVRFHLSHSSRRCRPTSLLYGFLLLAGDRRLELLLLGGFSASGWF